MTLHWTPTLLCPTTVGVGPLHTRQASMRTAVLEAVHTVCRTERNTVVYPTVCSLAGLVAGMFGVGGGIVKVRCTHDPCDLNRRLSVCLWVRERILGGALLGACTSQEACSLLQGTPVQHRMYSKPELPPSRGVVHVLSPLVAQSVLMVCRAP